MTVTLRFKVKKKPPEPHYPANLGLIRVVYEIGVYHRAPRDGRLGPPDEFICSEETVPREDVDKAIPFVRGRAFEELARKVAGHEETEG